MKTVWLVSILMLGSPVLAAADSNATQAPTCPATEVGVPLPDLGIQAPFLAACTATTDCPVAGGGTAPLTCSTPGSGTCVDFGYGVSCGSTTTYCACYRPQFASCGNEFCVCDCLASGGTLCGPQCRCPIEPF